MSSEQAQVVENQNEEVKEEKPTEEPNQNKE